MVVFPEGEFCPEITGTGWAIDELVITFPMVLS